MASLLLFLYRLDFELISQASSFTKIANTGVEMKMMNLVRMAIVIALMIHFTASGLVGFNGKGTAQTQVINTTLTADTIHKTVNSDEQHIDDKSIFSKATIIVLILAVVGLVAFRRNTLL